MFRRLFFSLVAGLGPLVVGCSPSLDRVPPRVPFEVDGSTYVWGLVHGVTGSLSLVRIDGRGTGYPEVIMTCQGTATGGLQIRNDAAGIGLLTVSARGRTFSVPSAPYEGLGVVAFSGTGVFEPGWFEALAAAGTVTIGFGGTSFEVRGPGEAAVGHYRRYCQELDRRARSG